MFPNLPQDIERYIPHEGLQEAGILKRIFVLALNQGLLATMVHRLGVSIRKIPVTLIRKPLLAVWFVLQKMVEIFFSIHISGAAELGPGFYIGHFNCFLNARFGRNCSVSQNVTIGHAGAGKSGLPTIGDNVYFAAGSVAFGPIVIGDNVKVGANAVVNKNIPSNSTAVGVPARAISRKSWL
ncbi:MAG: serine acetyltransferase [Candidatus Marinimicrobia bacterium]|nr:serine acetyltransferase [Candidatus Neomarinimicrobiota bacterium]